MPGVVARFRTKQSGAVTISVPWAELEMMSEADRAAERKPRPLHEFAFTVKIFSQSELNNAMELAYETMAKRGIKEPPRSAPEDERNLYNQQFNLLYWEKVAEFVKRHVSSFTHTPHDGSEPIKYSAGTVEAIFSEMEPSDLWTLGLSYLTVRSEEQKKRMSPVVMAPGSSNGSGVVSSMTSETAAGTVSTVGRNENG